MLKRLSAIKERFNRARNIADDIDTPEKKRQFNQQHFAVSAKRYDFATRAMSLGRDRSWKKQLITILPQGGAPNCLDLATGSGDLAFLLARAYPEGRVIGLDLTSEMLQLARKHNHYHHLDFVCADMATTGLDANSFDIITGSYALRNAADLSKVLDEIQRLLKPGGHAAFLDFSKSATIVAQKGQYRLLKSWCGLWGLLLHGDPGIHSYIADSLKQFPDRENFHLLLHEAGLELISSRLFYAGMLELSLVRKGASKGLAAL
jgi:demethylmenaquinone methyltransferase/2-methoxy-6-polyprenyl-1,4-benzoquinol methylase